MNPLDSLFYAALYAYVFLGFGYQFAKITNHSPKESEKNES